MENRVQGRGKGDKERGVEIKNDQTRGINWVRKEGLTTIIAPS